MKKMKNNNLHELGKPFQTHFRFTERTLRLFDERMKKIGIIYEGTLDNCLNIYKKNDKTILTIQFGFGGVMFFKFKNIEVDMVKEKITNSTKLSDYIINRNNGK